MPDRDEVIHRFWRRVDKSGDCWEWQGGITDRSPYGRFRSAGVFITLKAHRIAYELEFGPIPDDMFICHSCDNPRCVRPSHLFIGTPKDNAEDRDKKGRGYSGSPLGNPHKRGVRHRVGKLTDEQMLAIQHARDKGASLKSLAERYGVGLSTISRVYRGKQRINGVGGPRTRN